MKVNAKVIGKWIKGIIFKQPMLSVHFTDNGITPKYYDIPVRMALWNAVNIGDMIVVPFEREEDGIWYLK